MRWRNPLFLLALPVVVVLVGIVGAFLYFGDNLTPAVVAVVVSVGTLVGTTVKNGLDEWNKEQERKKKEGEKKERIKARAVLTERTELGVDLYNEGSSPVHIKQVFLVRQDGDFQVKKQMVTNWRLRQAGSGLLKIGIEEYDGTYLIEPKHSVIFHITGNDPSDYPTTLINLPDDHLTIEVESYEGLVARLPGADVKAGCKRHS